jgi:hypothetical protein
MKKDIEQKAKDFVEKENYRTENLINALTKFGEELLKEPPKQRRPYTLYLRVGVLEKLYFEFEDENYLVHTIGSLGGNNGRLHILSDDEMLENYELWHSKGCKIDQTPVKFRGWKEEGEYQLTDIIFDTFTQGIEGMGSQLVFKRIDIDRGNIYDLRDAYPAQNCDDPNVIKTKHNDRPVIF